MSKLIYIAVFCIGIINLYGSNSNTPDSFVTKINRTTLTDSVDYLIHIAGSNMQKYPVRAFKNALTAKEISDKIKLKYRSALATKLMGEAKTETSEYYEAEKYLLEAREFFTIEYPNILADIYYLLAKINYYLDDYAEAKINYSHAIKLFESTNNQVMVANAFQNLGLLHFDIGDIKKANYYYKKSLEINTKLNNQASIASLYQNIGILSFKNDSYSDALENFNKSLSIYQTLADTQDIASTYSHIGLIQLKQGKFSLAYLSFEKSNELFTQSHSELGPMWTTHNMGTAKLSLKEFDNAEGLYLKSLDLANRNNSKEGVLSNLSALTKLKELTGEFKEAFYYHSDYTELRDSIHTEETKNKVLELETLYQLQARENQLSESQLVISRQKNQTLAISILLFIISTVAVVIYIAYRKKKSSVVRIHSHKLNLESVLSAKNKELENEIMVRKIAEESDKLKSAFLANMSHELRTPMNAIIAFSNFLREPDLEEDKRHEYLDYITGAGDSLLQLIDDIIDIAKIESNQLKISIGPVNISRMMRELKKVFLKLKDKNSYTADLVLTIDKSQDYIVNTDLIRIKQILTNLIDNAFKYTHEGSVEFGMEVADDGLIFFVRDTGIGIPLEKQDKVFDRFLQVETGLNRKYGGTGLGLAICKNLSELLGGKIWFESKPDEGSIFRVIIPPNGIRTIEHVPEPVKSGKSVKKLKYNWENKTILIAENEELNFKILSSCLKKTKARIIWATDGAKAVDLCKKEQIDLVLMDIQMPHMNGYEATEKIKSFLDVPVIAQSSLAIAKEKEHCLNIGFNDYVTKPLNLNKLLQSIDIHFG